MHKASYQLMGELRTHVPSGARILDVGGANVNGSYKALFPDCPIYRTLDLKAADIIVTDHEWPLEDACFDAVISGQTFEHDEFFWLTMKNIARVLTPGGIAIVIAPAAGAVHRHPVDCWRFYPDAMRALAKWSGLQLIGTKSNDGPWKDQGGVFRKPG